MTTDVVHLAVAAAQHATSGDWVGEDFVGVARAELEDFLVGGWAVLFGGSVAGDEFGQGLEAAAVGFLDALAHGCGGWGYSWVIYRVRCPAGWQGGANVLL